MNLRDVMILVDDQDKTEDIREIHCDSDTNEIVLTYRNSEKAYKYNCRRVRKLENPSMIDLKNRAAFIGTMPVFEPNCILDFGEKIRIIGYNGKAQTVAPEEFHLLENGANSSRAEKILAYLKDIAQYTSEQSKDFELPEQTAFLKRQMDQLAYVHPDSVLSAYLNQNPIQQTESGFESIIFPFCFNLSQKKALENALTSKISVIEGPPGTGKTQTILNIIANLIAVQGKSVAVVSNNNEAVKNVMEKMAKNDYGFLCAMLGRKTNQDHFFSNMPTPTVDGWDCEEAAENLTQQIKALNIKLNELLKLDRERAQREQELLAWKLEQKHFEAYFSQQNVEEICKLPLLKANPERIIDFLAETSLAREREKSDTVIFKLKLLFKYSIYDQKKLRNHETAILLRLQKLFYQKQIEKLENEIADLNRQLEETHFETLLEEHQQLSEKAFRKYIYQSHSEIDEPNFTQKSYKVRFAEFIKTFPVILSTTHALRMSIPQNYLLDYVIIDEASQVDLITGALAFSCCRNVIIVGDTKQLPQITNQKIKEKLTTDIADSEYDYFEHSILSSVIRLYGKNLPREILREHYRCHPSIIEFCNQKYYGGELIPYTNPEMSDCPLLLYKTSEGNHMRRVTRGDGKGIYNQRELDVIIQEVLTSPWQGEENENIGIVTPFRKQANEAGKQLAAGIESDTVHKYQGREKEVMILSTVLSETQDTFNLEFVDDPQMVNVAVSRAIRQFILVTDHDLFYKKGTHISDLIRYIQYSTLDENVIESKIVSIFDLLYRRYSAKLIRYKAKMNADARYPSEEALRVLLDDILSKEAFSRFDYVQEMLLRNLLNDTSLLTEEELDFVNNRASMDFVIFYKQDKSCVLVIEVDGFAFHENNPKQLQKDRIKDIILHKYDIPILRLPTNRSGESEKICSALRRYMDGE